MRIRLLKGNRGTVELILNRDIEPDVLVLKIRLIARRNVSLIGSGRFKEVRKMSTKVGLSTWSVVHLRLKGIVVVKPIL